MEKPNSKYKERVVERRQENELSDFSEVGRAMVQNKSPFQYSLSFLTNICFLLYLDYIVDIFLFVLVSFFRV